MSTRIEIFEKALEKLRLREPVPDAVKEFVLYNKEKSLVSALKAGGEYSPVYNFTLKVYYAFGKAGVGLTVAQSKIILSLAAIVLGISVSAGAAVSYSYLSNDDREINNKGVHEDIAPEQTALPEGPGTQEAPGAIKSEGISPRDIENNIKKSIPSGIKQEVIKLSVITTKDGKTYTGRFRALGENVEVTTEEGKIIIPSGDIKSIAPYKEE